MIRRSKARRELAKDLLLVILGVVITIILVKSGALDHILAFLGGHVWGSFLSGIFFTSAFTLAPASVTLVRIAESSPAIVVSIFGALGAMCGDLILFLFIRDRFAANLMASLRPSFVKHFASSFHFGFLKWLLPLIGALIIASPLPDELGLGLMGLSKTRIAVLLPVAFVMNALGIYLLIWFAHSI